MDDRVGTVKVVTVSRKLSHSFRVELSAATVSSNRSTNSLVFAGIIDEAVTYFASLHLIRFKRVRLELSVAMLSVSSQSTNMNLNVSFTDLMYAEIRPSILRFMLLQQILGRFHSDTADDEMRSPNAFEESDDDFPNSSRRLRALEKE